jgi:hypothetical protein
MRALCILFLISIARAGEVDLILEPAGFKAPEASIRAILQSTADEFARCFPDRKPFTVRVSFHKEGPITLYERGQHGEHLVRLSASDTYWGQYAFQFAHELCHIYCNYRIGDESTKWFEETLCETASLFVLRRLSERWEKNPPMKSLASTAGIFKKYADDRIKKMRLPKDGATTLAEFYKKHADAVAARSVDDSRAAYATMAIELLDLFEEDPQTWQAVEHYNFAKPSRKKTFAQKLDEWASACPETQQGIVKEIRRRFGV